MIKAPVDAYRSFSYPDIKRELSYATQLLNFKL